jgi:nitrogen fixation protein FixH
MAEEEEKNVFSHQDLHNEKVNKRYPSSTTFNGKVERSNSKLEHTNSKDTLESKKLSDRVSRLEGKETNRKKLKKKATKKRIF